MAHEPITSRDTLYAAIRTAPDGKQWVDHLTLSSEASEPTIAAATLDKVRGLSWASQHPVVSVQKVTLATNLELLAPRASTLKIVRRQDGQYRLAIDQDVCLEVVSDQATKAPPLVQDTPASKVPETASPKRVSASVKGEDKKPGTPAPQAVSDEELPAAGTEVVFKQLEYDDGRVLLTLKTLDGKEVWMKNGQKSPGKIFPGKALAGMEAKKRGWVIVENPTVTQSPKPTPQVSKPNAPKSQPEAKSKGKKKGNGNPNGKERETLLSMPVETLRRIAIGSVGLSDKFVIEHDRHEIVDEIIRRRHPSTATNGSTPPVPAKKGQPNWYECNSEECRKVLEACSDELLARMAHDAGVEMYENISRDEVIEAMVQLNEELSSISN